MTLVWLAGIVGAATDTLLYVFPRILSAEEIEPGTIGWIMAIHNVTLLAGLALGGRVMNRIGPRWMLLLGCVGAAAGCLLYIPGGEGDRLVFYFAGRALHGLGLAGMIIAINGQALHAADVDKRGQTMGFTTLPGYLVLAFTPWIAEVMANARLERQLFAAAAVLCLVQMVFALAMRREPDLEAPEPTRSDPDANPDRRFALLMLFWVMTGFLMAYSRFLIALASEHKGAWTFAAFFGCYGIAAFVSRLVLEPFLRRRLSMVTMLSLACLIPLTAAAAAALHGWPAFGLVGLIFGFALGTFYPTLVQAIVEPVPRAQLMTRVGRMQAANMLGTLVALPIAGALAEHFGDAVALWIGAMVCLTIQVMFLMRIAGAATSTRVRETSLTAPPTFEVGK